MTKNDEKKPGPHRGFKIVNNILKGDELPITEDDTTYLGETILKHLDSDPDFIGQIDGITGKQMNYAEMKERSVKFAIWLRKQGIKQGDIVGLLVGHHLDVITTYLATVFVGAVCATWDHVLRPAGTESYLRLVVPKVVFLHDHAVDVFKSTAEKMNLNIKTVSVEDKSGADETLDSIINGQTSKEVAAFQCAQVENLQAPGLIVSSSGTSGPPKGTVISHITNARCCSPIRSFDMGKVTMWNATFRWYYGVKLALTALRTYSTRVIAPDICKEVTYCELIEKYNVEWFSIDPYIMLRILKYGLLEKYHLPSLKTLYIGGAHFSADASKATGKALPQVEIVQAYGLTDVGGPVMEQTRGCTPGSCGYILPEFQLKVIDLNTKKVLGPNKHGEFYIKARTIMNGYYKNPEATKKAFDEDGWLITGDVGYYTETGEIFIVDRISEFILYQSTNVSPKEIETVLEKHPAVSKAAVVGKPHEIDGEWPTAVVQTVPGAQVTEKELIELVDRELLDYYKLAGGVKFLEELPLTVTGKVAKKEIKKMLNTL